MYIFTFLFFIWFLISYVYIDDFLYIYIFMCFDIF